MSGDAGTTAASSLLTRLLGAIAAISLFGMMALTFASVIARYFLNRPIAGTEEVQSFLLGFVIFSAIPLVTLRQRHIAVHAFATLLRGRALELQRRFVFAVTALGFAFIAYLLFVQAEEMREDDILSSYLSIPEAPTAYIFAVLMAAAAVAAVILLLRPPRASATPASAEASAEEW